MFLDTTELCNINNIKDIRCTSRSMYFHLEYQYKDRLWKYLVYQQLKSIKIIQLFSAKTIHLEKPLNGWFLRQLQEYIN